MSSQQVLTICLLTCASIDIDTAICQALEPSALRRCLSTYRFGGQISQMCQEQLDLSEQRLRENLGLERNQIEYLWGLEAEILQTKEQNNGNSKPLHVRKECRAMDFRERKELFNAINHLKRNTKNPNEYLTLAKLHTGYQVYRHAHSGSNFLGWHRVYLVYFEKALQRVNRNISLCYYDATIDFALGEAEWTNTNAFSYQLFGNANGEVIDGPFAGWSLPSPNEYKYLTRRMEYGVSTPTDPEAVTFLLQSPQLRNHSSVTVGGDGVTTIKDSEGVSRELTIEGEHNNVHVWIGGLMAASDTAPLDPVFFFHHCYVDYLWEKYREKMMKYGAEPAKDYPGHGHSPSNSAHYAMIGFNWYTNVDGYSDHFTQELYMYDGTPSCENFTQTCNKYPSFMTCLDKTCVAKTTTKEVQAIESAIVSEIEKTQDPVIVVGHLFSPTPHII